MGAQCQAGLDQQCIEFEQDPRDASQLAGRWVSARGNVHVIGIDVVQWRSGATSKLRTRRRWDGDVRIVEYMTDLDGKTYTSRLTESGKLQWNDGDIWTRDQEGPQTATYAALAGVFGSAGETLHEALVVTPGALAGAIIEGPVALATATFSGSTDSDATVDVPERMPQSQKVPALANIFSKEDGRLGDSDVAVVRVPSNHAGEGAPQIMQDSSSCTLASSMQSQASCQHGDGGHASPTGMALRSSGWTSPPSARRVEAEPRPSEPTDGGSLGDLAKSRSAQPRPKPRRSQSQGRASLKEAAGIASPRPKRRVAPSPARGRPSERMSNAPA